MFNCQILVVTGIFHVFHAQGKHTLGTGTPSQLSSKRDNVTHLKLRTYAIKTSKYNLVSYFPTCMGHSTPFLSLHLEVNN